MRTRYCITSVPAATRRLALVTASLATLATALAPTTAVAQFGMPGVGAGAAGTSPRYGIIIGTNLSSISDADDGIRDVVGAAFDKKRRVGLNAGVFLNIPLRGAFSLQPEAHYSQQGVKYESNLTSQTQSASLNIDYVQIPVLLRVDVGSKSSSIHPILFAGASGAFRISCDVNIASGSTKLSEACDENTTSTEPDPVKKYDVSAVGGAGLAVNAMGRSYALTIRYAQGLANISTENNSSGTPRNSVISVQLGIGF